MPDRSKAESLPVDRNAHLSGAGKKSNDSTADVLLPLCRIVWAFRAARVWQRDYSLEEAVYVQIWIPFRDFLFHLIFVVYLIASCIGVFDQFNFFAYYHIDDVYVNRLLRLSNEAVVQYGVLADVDNVGDFEDYMNYALNVSLQGDDIPGIEDKMLLLGFPRLRQVRVRNDSCEHVWRTSDDPKEACFGYYSPSNMDTEPFGLGKGSAWTFREDPRGFHRYGYFGWYPSSGYFQDLPRNRSKAIRIFNDLMENNWIDEGTRMVFLDIVMYNMQINKICYTVLSFEILPTGALIPGSHILCSSFNQYATEKDHIILSIEIVLISYWFIYCLVEVKQFFSRNFERYKSGWQIIHLIMLYYTWRTFYHVSSRYSHATRCMYYLQIDGLEMRERTDGIVYHTLMAVRCLCVSTSLSWVLLFRYARFQMTTQILTTLSRSRFDLCAFFMMSGLAHFAFGHLGYSLFGHDVYIFRTISESCLGLLSYTLGEANLSETFYKFRIIGPIYFMFVVFILVFTFHNMFFVILEYNYVTLRGDPDSSQGSVYFGAFFRNLYLNVCSALNIKCVLNRESTTKAHLKNKFRKCGFKEDAIDVFSKLYYKKRRAEEKKQKIRGVACKREDFREIENTIDIMDQLLKKKVEDFTELAHTLKLDLMRQNAR